MPYLLSSPQNKKIGGNLLLYKKNNNYSFIEFPKNNKEGERITDLITKGIDFIKDNPTLIPSVVNAGKELFDAKTAVSEAISKQKELKQLKSIRENKKKKEIEINENRVNLNDDQLNEIASLGKNGNGFKVF